MSQHNNPFASQSPNRAADQAEPPTPGILTQPYHSDQELLLQQPVVSRPAQVTDLATKQVRYNPAAMDDTAHNNAVAPGTSPQPAPSTPSTPDFPKSGPEHDLAITESKIIMQEMQGNPLQSLSLRDAMMTTNDHLPQPGPAPIPVVHRAPSPLAWEDVTPNWMPGININPTDRPVAWHGRTNGMNVSARDRAKPRNRVERLELFRALYPSLHFVLKHIPGEDFDFEIDLNSTYKNALGRLRAELLEIRKGAFPHDKSQYNTEGLPQIGVDWSNYVEDWDVADHDQEVKDRILSNWNDPAREAWKARHCPLSFHPIWIGSPISRTFLDEQQQLREPGLPRRVSVVVRGDNQLWIVRMSE